LRHTLNSFLDFTKFFHMHLRITQPENNFAATGDFHTTHNVASASEFNFFRHASYKLVTFETRTDMTVILQLGTRIGGYNNNIHDTLSTIGVFSGLTLVTVNTF